MRAFICADVSDPSIFHQALRHPLFASRCIRRADTQPLHYTLFFIGETDDDAVDAISRELDSICGRIKGFEVVYSGIGIFGGNSSPRVLWAGVHDDENLDRIIREISAKLAALGYMSEERASVPHVTLARFRCKPERQLVESIIEEYRNTEFGREKLTRVHLKRSILHPGGAEHVILHTSLLGGADH
ncbi:MAG: RNA 2',3'-cyclic phosphodiesterase [Thermoplasmata archaeon]|uniref:RNA 2',3'-cyclic phosphodiesterase n=1 Tax=Candidatus Sysuiplasma superficiale TaxID=2823368 RepID=A0A8J7YNM4_9ARCH|nr:RNA 2',3'-cyclic phosphodiesterase [Candidatus Sysuiplasma superficiale]